MSTSFLPKSGRLSAGLVRRIAGVLALCGLAACAELRTPAVDFSQMPPPPQPRPPRPDFAMATPAPPASAGSIFQGQAYRPLFENIRARTVGDLLTVTIQENTTARQRSNSSTNREGSLEGGIRALPFVTSPVVARAKVGGSLSNDASAKGESGSDNVFNGTITATVAEVLPNGNFLIVGEKQVGVNQTVDSLRFSGIVDPKTIRPGNSIASTQIAEVRVEFRGRGDIDRALTTGWLQRFFFSYAPL
jgi:flagellar L-ring protein precursor FlgH